MCGTPVLVSDHCGSAILADDIRGKVFSIKKNNLEEYLLEFLKELPYNYEKRKQIKEWSKKNISGNVAAKYFEQILEYIMQKTTQRPVAPWLS
jgi:hypothetical protein